jgi:hypothetical protein
MSYRVEKGWQQHLVGGISGQAPIQGFIEHSLPSFEIMSTARID